MTRRLNITLPDDVVARADAFAKSERYTRSGLIAAALDAFVSDDTVVAKSKNEDAPPSARSSPGSANVHPSVAALIPAIIESCRRYGVVSAALVGSATPTDHTKAESGSLDILVDLGPESRGRSSRYFGLIAELEKVSERAVNLVDWDEIKNPYLRAEFERTQVVLYE